MLWLKNDVNVKKSAGWECLQTRCYEGQGVLLPSVNCVIINVNFCPTMCTILMFCILVLWVCKSISCPLSSVPRVTLFNCHKQQISDLLRCFPGGITYLWPVPVTELITSCYLPQASVTCFTRHFRKEGWTMRGEIYSLASRGPLVENSWNMSLPIDPALE